MYDSYAWTFLQTFFMSNILVLDSKLAFAVIVSSNCLICKKWDHQLNCKNISCFTICVLNIQSKLIPIQNIISNKLSLYVENIEEYTSLLCNTSTENHTQIMRFIDYSHMLSKMFFQIFLILNKIGNVKHEPKWYRAIKTSIFRLPCLILPNYFSLFWPFLDHIVITVIVL